MKRVLTGFLLLMAFAAAQSATTSTSSETVKQGQLRRGQQVYVWSCAMCHGDDAQGSPKAAELTGEDFLVYYRRLPMNLHNYIRDNMPEDRPGVLEEQEVLDVTAYLLDLNGVDFPESGLTLEVLQAPLQDKPKP